MAAANMAARSVRLPRIKYPCHAVALVDAMEMIGLDMPQDL